MEVAAAERGKAEAKAKAAEEGRRVLQVGWGSHCGGRGGAWGWGSGLVKRGERDRQKMKGGRGGGRELEWRGRERETHKMGVGGA